MSRSWGDDEFEPWLEHELQQVVGSVRGPSPRAEQAAYRATPRRRGALAVKTVVAFVAVALAVAGGVTGAAAMTGSANPLSLGHRMVRAVTMAGQHDQTPPAKPRDTAAKGVRPGASPRPTAPGDHEVDPTPEPVQSGVLKRDYEKDQNAQGQQSSRSGQTGPPGPPGNGNAKPKKDKHPTPSPTAGA